MKDVFWTFARFLTWIGSFNDTGSNELEHNGAIAISIPGIPPGDSDLAFCPESRDTDLFSVERISIHPTLPLVYPVPISFPKIDLIKAHTHIFRDEYIDIYLYGIPGGKQV